MLLSCRAGVVAVALLLTVTPGAAAQSTRTGDGTARVVWRHTLPFTTRPLLVDGARIFIFSGGNASALDARTGDVLWNYAGLTINEIAQQLGCACQNAAGPAGHGLYSVSGGDTLVALDPLTGDVRWSRMVSDTVASPAVATNGLVIAAGGNEHGFVIDAVDDAAGSLRWELRFTERPMPGLLAWHGLVFAPLSDGTLLAVDALTGRQVWREVVGDLPEPLAASQIASDGTLALRTQSAALALNATTGATRWLLSAPEFPPRPLVDGGYVYVATGTGTVSSLEASSGAVVWSRELGLLPTSEGLTAVAGRLLVTTFDGALIALDPSTGAQVWARGIGRMLAPLVVGHGGLYVGTLAGDLYIIDPATGAVRSKLSLGGAILFSPVSVGDMVYVATDDEQGTTVLAVDGL